MTAEDTAELVLTESGEAGDVTEPESEPEETTEEETAPVELVEIGDYKFGVKGGQRAQRGDTYYLIATFLFQNNSDSEASFDWSLDVDAYQNGVELSSASVYWLSGYDSASGTKRILPGAQIEVQKAWKMTEKYGTITLKAEELWNLFDGPTYTVSYEFAEE